MKTLKTQRNSKNCIVCGMENPFGLKAVFYDLDDQSVACEVTFRSEHQSYPSRTHGGMISTLLDEIMGRALWIKEPETFGVTTTMSVTFRRPVPFGVKLKARGYITFDSKMGFTAKGEIYDLNNNLLAESSARYLKMSLERAFGQGADFHQEMCYEMPSLIESFDFPDKRQSEK
ncbi:MAG: PaaI family thioesterase [Clostridia bacterium]|nr:PaaI family thioesterase [Clostridia bacterium]